jgi:hypothetical protein
VRNFNNVGRFVCTAKPYLATGSTPASASEGSFALKVAVDVPPSREDVTGLEPTARVNI